MVRRIEPAGSPARYETRVGDNHHHIVGRTFSYSDTQRYRVGTNYLQLPVNAPATAPNTNLSGGKMTHYVDNRGGDRHVNYEPSTLAGLSEAGADAGLLE